MSSALLSHLGVRLCSAGSLALRGATMRPAPLPGQTSVSRAFTGQPFRHFFSWSCPRRGVLNPLEQQRLERFLKSCTRTHASSFYRSFSESTQKEKSLGTRLLESAKGLVAKRSGNGIVGSSVGGGNVKTSKMIEKGLQKFGVRLPKLVPVSQLRERAVSAAKEKLFASWKRNRYIIIGLAVTVAIYYVWRTMFGVASMFIDLTESFAELGFLAISIAFAGAAYLYVKERLTIKPSKLYRMAMTRLNTSPSVLDITGAPLTGSHLQASVLSGGGMRMKGMNLKLRSRRLHMIFPIEGPEARGIVSIEAKKKKGKHQFKLLAVDIVSKEGQEQRIFLDGNESYYTRGGILRELRDPFLKVAAAQSAYEREDDEEDAIEPLLKKATAALQLPGERKEEEKELYFYEWSWELFMTEVSSLKNRLLKRRVEKL